MAWTCPDCGRPFHDRQEVCPACGPVASTARRWMCCECWTEGEGGIPDECPACGCTDSWFAGAGERRYGMSLKDVWDRLWEDILGPSRRAH